MTLMRPFKETLRPILSAANAKFGCALKKVTNKDITT
jgi:hypothetical protein